MTTRMKVDIFVLLFLFFSCKFTTENHISFTDFKSYFKLDKENFLHHKLLVGLQRPRDYRDKETQNQEKHKELEHIYRRQILFEGDITRYKRVRENKRKTNKFASELNKNKEIEARSFSANGSLWLNNVIPYVINKADFSDAEIQNLKNFINNFNQKTCLRLKEKETNDEYFLNITGERSGCWSSVGRQPLEKQPQQFNLQPLRSSDDVNCIDPKVFAHELGHTIGMWHEHARADRDHYIFVNLENVIQGQEANFDKENTADSHPYHLESIMHYGLYAFSKNGLPTITVKDDFLAFMVDETSQLSYYDIRDILTRYDCTGSCKTKPSCLYGAYLDQTCKCSCPEGLTGRQCESPVDHDLDKCGPFLIDISKQKKQVLTTKNYPHKMQVGYTCTWLVKASKGKQLKATIEFLSLASAVHGDTESCIHHLEMRYNLMGQSGPLLCKSITKPAVFVSTTAETPEFMFLRLNAKSTTDGSNGLRIRFDEIKLVPPLRV